MVFGYYGRGGKTWVEDYLAKQHPEAKMKPECKERHWPEDVLFDGALGWTIAQIVFSWRWPVRLGL
jgi:hypothetical protein